jgi:glycosyltransferase involved in cell wall biosynthesis
MDSMGPILGDLDAVLLTSRTEGLPVALIEAGAAGVPAVAAAVGGVEEVLAHERTGFVGENVDELAYGLARLLDEPEERANMGQRARMRVTARHSAQALAQRLEALYQTLLQEEPCAC